MDRLQFLNRLELSDCDRKPDLGLDWSGTTDQDRILLTFNNDGAVRHDLYFWVYFELVDSVMNGSIFQKLMDNVIEHRFFWYNFKP